MELNKLNKLWDEFENIPVNNDDEIEKIFLGFEIGTCRFAIWAWFEEQNRDFIIHKIL